MLKRNYSKSQKSDGNDAIPHRTKKKKICIVASNIVPNFTTESLKCHVVLDRISVSTVDNSGENIVANDMEGSVEPSLVMSVDECPAEVKTEPTEECYVESEQGSVGQMLLTDNDENSVPVFRSILSFKPANQVLPLSLPLPDSTAGRKASPKLKTGTSGRSLNSATSKSGSMCTPPDFSSSSGTVSKPPLNVTAIVLRCAAPGSDAVSGAEAAARLLAKHRIHLGKSSIASCPSDVPDGVIQQPVNTLFNCENVDELKKLLVESNNRKYQLAKELKEEHQTAARMNQQIICLEKVVIELHKQLEMVDPDGYQEFCRKKLKPLQKGLQGMNVEGVLYGV